MSLCLVDAVPPAPVRETDHVDWHPAAAVLLLALDAHRDALRAEQARIDRLLAGGVDGRGQGLEMVLGPRPVNDAPTEAADVPPHATSPVA